MTRFRLKKTAQVLAILGGGILIGILLLAFVLAGEIYDFQESVDGTHLPQVDAIVCLAGGRGRIAAAGDLWFRYFEAVQTVKGKLPILYISGMGHQSTWHVFARQLRAGVKDVIKEDQVILETESGNTPENAEFLGKVARANHWHSILLMTSSYHMRRSLWIFDRVLKKQDYPMKIETLSIIQDPFEAGEWRVNLYGVRISLVEYLKWVYYRFIW